MRINITDDANTSFSSPPPVNQPMLGVGVNSSVTGYLKLENPPNSDISLIDKRANPICFVLFIS